MTNLLEMAAILALIVVVSWIWARYL